MPPADVTDFYRNFRACSKKSGRNFVEAKLKNTKGERHNMLRSMYSGISGLKNFQTKLDVIGNNIANVNTHGFKKGRVVFKDLISQSQGSASGPAIAYGGVNAKQVGLGSTMAAIDTIHGTGSTQNTGRTLDVALQGDGYFVVGKFTDPNAANNANPNTPPPVITNFEEVRYTRAGNFYLDSTGVLVNANGDFVIGYGSPNAATDPDPDGLVEGELQHLVLKDPQTGATVDPAAYDSNGGLLPTVTTAGKIIIPTDAQSMGIGEDGKVTYVDATGNLMFAGQLVVAKFSNAEGLVKQGNNYYLDSANSGAPQFGAGNSNGVAKTVSSALEMSNVDLSEEFTEMIVAQRGFQANTRIITTSDEILQELVNLKR